MVLLVTTPTILSALDAVPAAARETLDLPESPALDGPISHEQLIALARWYTRGNAGQAANTTRKQERREGDKKEGSNADDDRLLSSEEQGRFNAAAAYTLNSLLRGTKIYIPPPPPKPEPSPEYLALKARLQAAAEADAYNRMLYPTHSKTPQPEPIFSSSNVAALQDEASAIAEYDPLTPSLVLNIFLSILLTGFSSYWALSNYRTPGFLTFATKRGSALASGVGTASQPVRVLVSLFAGLFIGIAEVVLYAIYWRKVDDARKRERKLKEKKEVIGPVGDGGESQPEKAVDIGNQSQAEKEEIWGRGVNGGMRRRVRERWEERERDKGKNSDEQKAARLMDIL
ncbi:conserved hypothetical protein [Paecilomyces variotii No. 5]|uniref:Endoplasmic reticulum-based factor for assembly of V-ATPase-domain-containing protein n=1 Tax=Byssochlamys spectabilis (strain No. 5 / NBRC 109023) TaxID=1356009 RepID=V5F8B0_BYSSN|nr:conserved hypothetical protein [Paecilomyces variotii No. 5]